VEVGRDPAPFVVGCLDSADEKCLSLGLDEVAARLVYRAAAEALRNVERHAQANRIAVSVERDEAGVQLVVADNGAGFAPEDRERRREEGHVGLSLLEELAARAGGRLDVRSAPGEGTTFELELPYA
jgi:signal transduction histidine kinase